MQNKIIFIINYFTEHNPNAGSELNYENAFQLLVAVILSAQCTDKRVNMVTPLFFKKYDTPNTLASSSEHDIYEIIKSVSYPNNKAKHLLGMAQKLVTDFRGVVPDTLDKLIQLPGVGRKTANVILSVIFQKPAMAVDTHVYRVSHRIGIVKDAKTPLETERQLVELFPKKLISKAHHWIILHGRYICLARRPKCVLCGLQTVCDTYLNVTGNVKKLYKTKK